MAITLATMTTEVRSILDEPNAQFWSNAEITTWINQGCENFAQRTRTLRTQETVQVVAQTQNYIAPADLYAINRVEFVPTSHRPGLHLPPRLHGLQRDGSSLGGVSDLPRRLAPSLHPLGKPSEPDHPPLPRSQTRAGS